MDVDVDVKVKVEVEAEGGKEGRRDLGRKVVVAGNERGKGRDGDGGVDAPGADRGWG